MYRYSIFIYWQKFFDPYWLFNAFNIGSNQMCVFIIAIIISSSKYYYTFIM